MLNAICITTNQLEHIQTNLCIHLSYLEDQRNLKIYNKNIKKKKKMCASNILISFKGWEIRCMIYILYLSPDNEGNLWR